MTKLQDIYPSDRVSLREVGLRDGLQLVKTFPSTEAKRRWVRDEYAAGVRCFEVGSFLPAKTFPQFVDVREIVATIASLPGAHGIALASKAGYTPNGLNAFLTRLDDRSKGLKDKSGMFASHPDTRF